jgi:hypothetical protein
VLLVVVVFEPSANAFIELFGIRRISELKVLAVLALHSEACFLFRGNQIVLQIGGLLGGGYF